MSDPKPIHIQPAPPTSNSPANPQGSSATYAVTAVIFFLLGFLTAGLIGFSLWEREGYADPTMVADAVLETFVALTPTITPTATTAPHELSYYPQRAYLIGGSWDAPVKVVEFSDYRCPWCGAFARDTLPQLLSYYPPEMVAFIYRDYPIFGEESVYAAHAARCANEQENFADYHFLLFASQQQIPPVSLEKTAFLKMAQELNLDETQFESCLQRESISQEIMQNYFDGTNLLIQAGTPTFLINGRRFTGSGSLQFFIRIINEELERQGITPP